MDTEENDPP